MPLPILKFHDAPECPHCGKENRPPLNRYISLHDTFCEHCREPFRVTISIRYAAQPISEPTAPPPDAPEDFVCERIEDVWIAEATQAEIRDVYADDKRSHAQKNEMVWALLSGISPKLRELREGNTHGFSILENRTALRVFHPKGCQCATKPTT